MQIEALEKKLSGIQNDEARKNCLLTMLDYVRKKRRVYEEDLKRREEEKRELSQNILKKILKNLPSQLLKMKVKEFKGKFDESINFQLLGVENDDDTSIGFDCHMSEGTEIEKRVAKLSFEEIGNFKGKFFSGCKTPSRVYKRIKASKNITPRDNNCRVVSSTK